jgi:O-antigen/teichoic acid export membrane protein
MCHATDLCRPGLLRSARIAGGSLKFTSNAVWLTGCRAAGDVLNLLLFVVISRHFGPAGVGEYSYSFAVATFVFVIACLGIEEFGLREYARIEATRRQSFFAELLGAQLLMIAVALIGLVIYLAATAPTPATLLIVGLLTFFQAAVALARTLFIPSMSQQRMVQPAITDLATRAIAFGVAGVAIQIGDSALPYALIGCPAAGIFLLLVSARSAARHGAPVRVAISRRTVNGIVSVLWSFALIEVFAQLLARIGVITLTLKAGEAAAGVFATGLRLVEVSLMPLAFLGVAAYPRLSQLYATDPGEFRRGGMQLMWLMVLVSAAGAWGLSFVAPALLVPVLGTRFAGKEPVIASMALVALVQGLEATLGRLLYSSDRQVPRAGVIVAGAIINTTLCLILVPRIGVHGAIYAAAASYAAIDIAYAILLRRPITARRLLRILLTMMVGVAGGVISAAIVAAEHFPRWAEAGACAMVFLTIVGLVYWYGTLRATPPPANASQV